MRRVYGSVPSNYIHCLGQLVWPRAELPNGWIRSSRLVPLSPPATSVVVACRASPFSAPRAYPTTTTHHHHLLSPQRVAPCTPHRPSFRFVVTLCPLCPDPLPPLSPRPLPSLRSPTRPATSRAACPTCTHIRRCALSIHPEFLALVSALPTTTPPPPPPPPYHPPHHAPPRASPPTAHAHLAHSSTLRHHRVGTCQSHIPHQKSEECRRAQLGMTVWVEYTDCRHFSLRVCRCTRKLGSLARSCGEVLRIQTIELCRVSTHNG